MGPDDTGDPTGLPRIVPVPGMNAPTTGGLDALSHGNHAVHSDYDPSVPLRAVG